MPTRAENLFERLQSRDALEALIGQPEDADFDCKQWTGRGEAARGSIAKAASGFANATGGVIVIGLVASGRGAETPDVVQSLAPVTDREAVASEALDIILKFVEPGIEGVQVKTVRDKRSGKSGYVLLHIPEAEDRPRRSKIDWKFYVRVASGTLPMEYFQMEDRFGRRPHPRLIVELSDEEIEPAPNSPYYLTRTVALSVRNAGRGLARFPAVRFLLSSPFVLRTVDGILWPSSNADGDWLSLRGRVNDVVYPGESLRVAPLTQMGRVPGIVMENMGRGTVYTWQFSPASLTTQVMCDGIAPHEQVFNLPERENTRTFGQC